MRICFYNVTASFIPGGLETYCWEAGRALARRGHEVTIVAGDRGEARHDEVSLIRFPFRIEQSWPKFGTRFRRIMERLSFAHFGGLAHLLQANYDLVVINKPFDFPVLWEARRRGMQSKVFFRSGGTEFFWGDRYFSSVVDFWVSTSRYNADQVEAHYDRSVAVIHNGVDTERFCVRERTGNYGGIPDDARVIMSAGRLVGWKGLRVIIDALATLPADVHYLMLGEGSEQEELARHAEQRGVATRVHFAGRIPHAELPHWLSRGDVFVQPSIGEESFGISVVEAMACGLPVLASDNGGMREIVISGSTGRLLKAGDVNVWRSALEELLDNPDLRTAQGAAARQRSVDSFTWAANAAALERMVTMRAES